jgi:hypothetical protein
MPNTLAPPSRRRILGRFLPALLLLPVVGEKKTLQTEENLTMESEASSTSHISITRPTRSVPRRG